MYSARGEVYKGARVFESAVNDHLRCEGDVRGYKRKTREEGQLSVKGPTNPA
jgi:hypothetical protein